MVQSKGTGRRPVQGGLTNEGNRGIFIMSKGSMRRVALATAAVSVLSFGGQANMAEAQTDANDRVISLARAADPTRSVAAKGDLSATSTGVQAKVGEHLVSLTATDTSRARTFSDASGASLYSVLENKYQRAEFRSTLPKGASWKTNPDGSLSAIVKSPSATLTLAHVAPPFAVDATGKRLDTRYKVTAANTIEQEVDTRSARFPVAADPKLTYGWGIYLNAFGAEWKALLVALTGAGGVGAWGSCSLIKVSGGWGNVLKTACSGIGLTSLKSILKWALGNWKALPLNNGTCYQTKLAPRDGKLKAVSYGNCR